MAREFDFAVISHADLEAAPVTPAGEWRRPSHCDTSGCPEWLDLGPQGVRLRTTTAPRTVLCLDEQERADLVRAVLAGELGPPTVRPA